MWSQNSFGINGSFPSRFSQEDFLYPSKPFQNSAGTLEPHFSGPQHDNIVDLSSTNCQNYQGLKNDVQSDAELFDQLKLSGKPQASNQTVQGAPRPQPNVQNSNQHLRPSAPQISSRAAELKAQLLARRANPLNSSNNKPALKPETSTNVNGLNEDKPDAPISSNLSPDRSSINEKAEPPLNLSDLISQYSESKSKTENKKIVENNQVIPVKPIVLGTTPSIDTQNSATKSVSMSKKPIPIPKEKSISKLNNKDHVHKVDLRVSEAETSEGEIVEDSSNSKNLTTSSLIDTIINKNAPKNDEKPSRQFPINQTAKVSENRSPHEVSTMQFSESPSSQFQVRGFLNHKSPQSDARLEEKIFPVCPKSDNKLKPNFEKNNQFHNEARSDESHRSEVYVKPGRVEPSRPKTQQVRERERETRIASPPLLQHILSHDTDLREWLEITGYHNQPYRDKILSRRRAIAALDAQREKLIAEIEAEERGCLPVQSQPVSSSMLPPPIPIYKTGDRVGIIPIATTSPASYIASNKRPLSQTQDPYHESGPGKIARTENSSYSPRNNDDLYSDSRRPRSSDHDTSSRHLLDHYDEFSRTYVNSNQEAINYLEHERRSPARNIGYENDPYDEDEISEIGTRSFEARKNHRGRAFDPKHRGRGRVKGRGDIRDSRDSPESRGEISSSSLKIVNGRPSKNPRGPSRGSRGNI